MRTIDVFSSAASLAILAWASIQDARTREVKDEVWIVGLGVGAIIDLFRLLNIEFSTAKALQYLRAAVPILIILVLCWVFHLVGEADILAFLTLLVLQPTHPLKSGFFHPAFCTFTYSNLLMISVPLLFLARNLILRLRGSQMFAGFDEPVFRKFLAMFLALPVKAEVAKRYEYFSLAEIGAGEHKRFRLSSALTPPVQKEKRELPDEGYVWICPSIPLLPFILVGHIITMTLGDPIILLLSLFQ